MTANAVPEQPQARLAARLAEFPAFWKRLQPRLRDFIVHVFAQPRILQKVYPGVMHFLIFWGVTIQVIGTAINLMQMKLFTPFELANFPRNNWYLGYELVMDLAGGAILIGVLMALYRRLIWKPKTLETRWDDYYALIMLALIPLAGFTTESLRLVASNPPWAAWSPIGNTVAGWMRSLGVTPAAAAAAHDWLFWTHAAIALVLVASIPFTKMRHLVFTPLNVVLHPLRKAGVLEKIEDIETAEKLGVGEITEFTSRQLLSFDACLRCGRCEEKCPVSISGQEYSPRKLIQHLRTIMVDELINQNGQDGRPLSEALPPEDTWACTTCGACLTLCPAFVNPVDEVIDLRRYQALTTGKLPKSVADTLRNLERKGNPWGMAPESRMDWAEGLEVRELAPGEETDVLLFLGCAFAFDERNKKVARAFVRLLQKAQVNFAVLGFDEMCCGETARRLGHEYLFQELARQNIETLQKVRFQRIVTQCPHCFNTLKNEYPQLGGSFRVQHYTEFLAELPLPGLRPDGQQPITYHDSCYLGRYNQIFAQPRQLLRSAGIPLVEMPRHGMDSLCCGGGGGQMWMETDASTRINHVRLKDAQQTQASTVATACPYCLLMFDDAIRSKGLGEQMQVMDIAEVLEKQL